MYLNLFNSIQIPIKFFGITTLLVLAFILAKAIKNIKNFSELEKNIYSKNLSLLLIIIVIFSGCQKEIVDEVADLQTITDDVPFSINNSVSSLSSRIKYINRTATIKPIVSSLSNKGFNSKSEDVNGAQELYFWEHVAEVEPLQFQGYTLSATHITLSDNKAYVSYHKQGDLHLGAVEIIDLSNPNFPEIITQATFPNADVNAVTSGYSEDSSNLKVWMALSNEKKGALLFELEAQNGQFIDEKRRVNLSNKISGPGVSASANGIAVTNDYLYVTSGKTHGGTVQLNKTTLDKVDSESYSNAKYVAVNGMSSGSKVVSLVTGDIAKIKVNSITDNLESATYNIGSIWHQNVVETYRGKSTMEFSPKNSNLLYIAKGKDGLGLVDVNNGEVVNESKGSMLVVGNTNGVSTDSDYVYTANGSDGISISPHPTNNGDDILPIFYWDMAEEGASANYVIADGEWVFIAKGGGGFKILRKRVKDEYKTITTYNNNGKPDGLEEDKAICSTLLPNIYANVLPERQNAMLAHPEYFLNPVKNIVVKEETELYLTFIDEGAGYRNVLGYYTYHPDDLLSNENQLDKIVIFPNASAQGSGGELIKGNTMRLLGSFKPGTIVGFFLIANGWRNGKITDGYYSQHTDINFNLSGRQQSIIFYDATCNSTVIAFEDISVPNGDNDFNDAIFEISSSNPNALDTTGFVQIGN